MRLVGRLALIVEACLLVVVLAAIRWSHLYRQRHQEGLGFLWTAALLAAAWVLLGGVIATTALAGDRRGLLLAVGPLTVGLVAVTGFFLYVANLDGCFLGC